MKNFKVFLDATFTCGNRLASLPADILACHITRSREIVTQAQHTSYGNVIKMGESPRDDLPWHAL
jgi:hypothetical protein